MQGQLRRVPARRMLVQLHQKNGGLVIHLR